MRGWRWIESAIREKNGGAGADIKPGEYLSLEFMMMMGGWDICLKTYQVNRVLGDEVGSWR